MLQQLSFALLLCSLPFSSQEAPAPVPPMPASRHCPLKWKASEFERYAQRVGDGDDPLELALDWRPYDSHGGVLAFSGISHGRSREVIPASPHYPPRPAQLAEVGKNIQSFHIGWESQKKGTYIVGGGDWIHLLSSVEWVEITRIHFRNGDDWYASDDSMCTVPVTVRMLCIGRGPCTPKT